MPGVGGTAYPHRMYNFDLQLLLFLLIALLAMIAGGAVWLDRALSRRRSARVFGEALEDAPFGALRLNRVGEAQYANVTAQRLLDLPASRGPLPPRSGLTICWPTQKLPAAVTAWLLCRAAVGCEPGSAKAAS